VSLFLLPETLIECIARHWVRLQPRALRLQQQCELKANIPAYSQEVASEEENDNYNYEKGVHATIPIQWDEAGKALTIGDRSGEFPGMLRRAPSA
jgi:hypothetical protein